MDRVESHLQVDILSSIAEASIEVKNSQKHPIHVMDIEVVFEEPGREKGERKAMTTKIHHSCIVLPRSSKLVKVPLTKAPPVNEPYLVKANVNVKDRVHGVYQVSTGRVRQMFSRDPTAASKKPPTAPSPPRLDGRIEGMHLKTFFPKEVLVAFELLAKNANFLPLKFLHADFTVRSGDVLIFKKKLVQNTSIPSKSSQVLKMALAIPLQAVRNSFPQGLPSSVLPVEMDIEFWFKETFYGTYKIDARRTGVLVIPEEPEIKIQKVIFDFEEKNPVARLELLISNTNSFDLDLTSVEYQAFSKETGSSLIRAKFKKNDEGAIIIPSKGSVTVASIARPSSHEFGSVLWQLCKAEPYYNVKTVLEADTKAYGRIVFQS